MVYTLTLNPALDYVMKVGSLDSDDIIRAEKTVLNYGGKGINVSTVLTRLGVENKALGFLAGFTGKELEKRLTADGIDCDFTYLESGETRINVKIKAEREYDVNAAGPNVSERDIENLFEKLDAVGSGDILVLAGSVPDNLPTTFYEKIMKRLGGRGVKFVVDTTGEALKNALKYKPFLVKPNHVELGGLFGEALNSTSEVVHYANELRTLGAQNVLVSRAENGAVLVDEYNTVSKIETVKGELVNSTGCGDSMLAGFIAAYINTGDYAEALRLGVACGSATAFSAALATKEEIYKIFESV